MNNEQEDQPTAAQQTGCGGNDVAATREETVTPQQEVTAAAPTPSAEALERTELSAVREELSAVREELATLRQITQPAIDEREQERQALVAELAGNERVPFTQDELEAKPFAELRKLQTLARGVNFGSRGGPRQAAVEPAVRFMEPVPYFNQKSINESEAE